MPGGIDHFLPGSCFLLVHVSSFPGLIQTRPSRRTIQQTSAPEPIVPVQQAPEKLAELEDELERLRAEIASMMKEPEVQENQVSEEIQPSTSSRVMQFPRSDPKPVSFIPLEGAPPPPPPPPPAGYLAPPEPRILRPRRTTQNKRSPVAPRPSIADMVKSSKGQGGLRPTRKSPGGTPVREQRRLAASHPQDLIARALRSKFQSINVVTPSPEKENVDDWDDVHSVRRHSQPRRLAFDD